MSDQEHLRKLREDERFERTGLRVEEALTLEDAPSRPDSGEPPLTVDRVVFRTVCERFTEVPSAFAITTDGREWRLSREEIARALNRPDTTLSPQDGLAGLDERLDRLLLTADDGGRFVLSTESAKNIVGIVREWLRPTLPRAEREVGS